MNQTLASVEQSRVTGADRGPGWLSIGPHPYVRILIVAALVWWVFRFQVGYLVRQWVEDPSWSHGFLIPLFSLYFVNQRKKEILAGQSQPSIVGLLLLIACLIFHPLNVVQFRIAYFESLTVVAAIGATVLFLGGWQLLRLTWLPVLYLVFALPLPARLYRDVTIPMRIFAADIATAVLDAVPDLQAKANGVVIDVVFRGRVMDPPLNVAEACSGMRLLMAFFALGVAMAYLHDRPFWHRIVLLLSTLPIAILCNVLRVTVTGLIYVLWDPAYAQGIYHDMLGLLMLPVAFGLYGLLAWFMMNLFVEDKTAPDGVIVRRKTEVQL